MPPIFDGQHITCPHCRKQTSILDIETLPEKPVYQHETVPVYRCRQEQDGRVCNYVFALRPSPFDPPGRAS